MPFFGGQANTLPERPPWVKTPCGASNGTSRVGPAESKDAEREAILRTGRGAMDSPSERGGVGPMTGSAACLPACRWRDADRRATHRQAHAAPDGAGLSAGQATYRPPVPGASSPDVGPTLRVGGADGPGRSLRHALQLWFIRKSCDCPQPARHARVWPLASHSSSRRGGAWGGFGQGDRPPRKFRSRQVKDSPVGSALLKRPP